MAANVGEVEITVKADSKTFLADLKATAAAAAKIAEKNGRLIGTRLGSAFSQGAEKETSQGFEALKTGGSFLIGAIPMITSLISDLAGGASALVGSLLRSASAAGSLAGVVGALGQAVVVGKIAFSGLGKAIGGDTTAMAKLAPAAQQVAKAAIGIKDNWNEVRKSIQAKTFAGLGSVVRDLGQTYLPVLQKQFGAMGTQINLALKDVGKWAASRQTVGLFGKTLAGNTKIFGQLRQAAVPILDAILRLFHALQPTASATAGVIVRAARSFDAWISAGKNVKAVQSYVEAGQRSFATLWRLVTQLGAALFHVFNAGANQGDSMIASLADLATKFNDFTKSAEGSQKIAAWIQTGVGATRQLGQILVTLAPLMAALFSPQRGASFIKVLSGLMPIIVNLVNVVTGALAPAFASIGKALAENGPAIGKLFIALSPLLKGLGAILGQIISQAIGVVGLVAKILTPVVAVISNILGPILVKLAPIIATIILSFGDWEITIGKTAVTLGELVGKVVESIPIFGRILAPFVELAFGIQKIVMPAIRAFGELAGVVFGGLAAKIGPLVGRLVPVVTKGFELMGQAVGVLANLFWDNTKVWARAAAVIGLVLTGLWVLIRTDFNLIRKTVGVTMDVIATVLRVAWQVIRVVFTTYLTIVRAVVTKYFAFYRQIIVTAFAVIRTVVTKAWQAIRTVFTVVLAAIRAVVARYFAVYRAVILAAMNLIRTVVTKAWQVIRAVTTTVLRWISGFLRAEVNGWRNVVTAVMNAIRTVTRTVWGVVRSTISNACSAITSTVRKAWNLVQSLTSGAFNSLKTIIGKAMNAATGAVRSGVNAIGNALHGVVTAVSNLSTQATNAAKNVGSSIIHGIIAGLSAAGGVASSLASSIKSAVNSALHLPFTIHGPGPLPDFHIPAFAAKGGIMKGGLTLVGEQGPELVSLPRGSRVYDAATTRGMRGAGGGADTGAARNGGGFPRRVVLQIRDRSFEAYLVEVADSRVNAADALAWQGA